MTEPLKEGTKVDASNFQKGLRSRAEAAEASVKRLEAEAAKLRDDLLRERETRADIIEAVNVLAYFLDESAGIDKDELIRLAGRLRKRVRSWSAA